MQTMLRAATMLAVLVGLPAAWVYYGPLPPQAQAAVDRMVASAKGAVEWERWMANSDVRVAPPAALVPLRPVSAVTPQAPPAAVSAPAPSLADRVEPLLVQLRGGGAAEYQLEPWGDGGRHFRFWCAMPIAEGSTATQLFEAVAAEPQAAVERVAADVAAWQASKLTAMR